MWRSGSAPVLGTGGTRQALPFQARRAPPRTVAFSRPRLNLYDSHGSPMDTTKRLSIDGDTHVVRSFRVAMCSIPLVSELLEHPKRSRILGANRRVHTPHAKWPEGREVACSLRRAAVLAGVLTASRRAAASQPLATLCRPLRECQNSRGRRNHHPAHYSFDCPVQP